MIDEVSVRNLALIESASLQPSTGLTVLTGETGAGKTALLSALKLLMGGRASSDMVRDGASELSVSGRFVNIRVPQDSFEDDETAGHEDEAGRLVDELIVSRRVSADGRTRATLDGEMASVHELAACIAPAVDLCGQFEHQQLMKMASHVALLDTWAGSAIAEALEAYRQAFADARAASDELAHVRDASALSEAKLDDARFILRRINEIDPKPDEYETLKHDLAIAEHAETLARSASEAHVALADDGGVLDALGSAATTLDAAGNIDATLTDVAQSLREASCIVEDAARTVRDYLDTIEFDPIALAQQQERFSSLQGLLRAYGPRMEDVLARKDEAADIVSLVDDATERLEAAEHAYEQAERKLSEAADALDAARAQAAPRFAAQVTETMHRLEMGSAELVYSQQRLARERWTLAGPSTVEFMYRPGSGMQARPFARIASGGEVSRVMLAVKVALGEVDPVDTLVFDEVDAGVGGATAVALAQVIADLARTHQIIVVTHLAQVAVKADTHYVVRRSEDEQGGTPKTILECVEGDARVNEIARMLSGDASQVSRAHARELLGM